MRTKGVSGANRGSWDDGNFNGNWLFQIMCGKSHGSGQCRDACMEEAPAMEEHLETLLNPGNGNIEDTAAGTVARIGDTKRISQYLNCDAVERFT